MNIKKINNCILATFSSSCFLFFLLDYYVFLHWNKILNIFYSYILYRYSRHELCETIERDMRRDETVIARRDSRQDFRIGITLVSTLLLSRKSHSNLHCYFIGLIMTLNTFFLFLVYVITSNSFVIRNVNAFTKNISVIYVRKWNGIYRNHLLSTFDCVFVKCQSE